MKQYPIPILLVIFNRAKKTKDLFEIIKQIKPKILYIAADGPRNEKDIPLIKQTRDVIKVDWDCDVHYLYQEKNLGVAKNPSYGITKMFEDNEFGIILEDDIVPTQSFFRYCEELLIKYRNDERIGFISGSNPTPFNSDYSYLFTNFGYTYGWATWKRVWDKYDFEIKSWAKLKHTDFIKKKFNNVFLKMHWYEYFNRVEGGSKDAWDYQFMYTIITNNYLVTTPKHSLVKNVGFIDESASHKQFFVPQGLINSSEMEFPLKHPEEIKADEKLDLKISKQWRRIMFQKLFTRPVKQIPRFFKFL